MSAYLRRLTIIVIKHTHRYVCRCRYKYFNIDVHIIINKYQMFILKKKVKNSIIVYYIGKGKESKTSSKIFSFGIHSCKAVYAKLFYTYSFFFYNYYYSILFFSCSPSFFFFAHLLLSLVWTVTLQTNGSTLDTLENITSNTLCFLAKSFTFFFATFFWCRSLVLI